MNTDIRRNAAVLLVVIAVITGMLWYAAQRARRGRGEYSGPRLQGGADVRGMQVPDAQLKSLDGRSFKLSDYRGKAVIVNFWATWCQPCKIEIPWLIDLQKQYRPEGLEVIGISLDESDEDDVADFAEDIGINYTVAMGTDAIGDAFGGVQGLPMTFYVDRNGKIIERVLGIAGHSEMETTVKKALATSVQPTVAPDQRNIAADGNSAKKSDAKTRP